MVLLLPVSNLQVFKTVGRFVDKAVLIWVSVLFSLGGCGITQPYGSFIQNPSSTYIQYSQAMADDVIAQIMRAYPAASTQFNLRHRVSDPFGRALIEKLRSEGYAIQEAIHPANSLAAAINQPERTGNADGASEQNASQDHGLAFGYIVDQSGDLYHVGILIEDQQLTRAFKAQSGKIQPAGFWVRKE